MTDVLADKREPSIAYVTLSGYNLDETNPHIFRTTDYGMTWNDISGNIPDVPVNSIIIDYDKDSRLYVGTDAGVYYTENLGDTWSVLGPGLPNSPVFDINYHQPTKKLVAGTHGRSLFEFDLSSITSVEGESNIIVNGFELFQNYPNPFNPGTRIAFTLTLDSNVEISIYDITGQKIVDIINNNYQAGKHEVHFNGSDLSSGIYFYKITANGSDGRTYSDIKKMILLR